MTSGTTREACLRAYLALLAERPPARIDLADVAAHCGVSLSEMRVSFASTDDLLAAFFRDTDRHVLAAGGADSDDLSGEGPRERLFEVLMRRLDALDGHKEAVRTLMHAARTDPVLALKLARLSEASQRWMLAAAGISCTGLAGSIRAKGLALLFARVVEVWLRDEDPGLSRTMAFLDRQLETGGKLLGILDDLAYLAAPWRGRRRPVSGEAPAAEDVAVPPA